MEKKLIYLLTSLLILVVSCSKREVSQDELDQKMIEDMEVARVENYAIKTAAYWTSPIMSQVDARNLAKHDLLIVDLENKFNNRKILLELKKMNPNIKLLAYSNPMEIFLTLYASRPWQNKVIEEITQNRRAWLLQVVSRENPNQSKSYSKFWPGMVMLNLSSTCPKIDGETYSEWMAKKINTEILSDNIFDGYFMDNGTVNISWLYEGQGGYIDVAGNGSLKPNSYVDKKWSEGVRSYLSYIKNKGKLKKGLFAWFSRLFQSQKSDRIVVSNKGDLNLLDIVDGKFFEKFPNDYLGETWLFGWRQSLFNAQKTGEYTVINVEHNNLYFGLASCLLLDNAYLSIGQDYSASFKDLNINPGKPLGEMQVRNLVYTREYENISVAVYPQSREGVIRRKVKR